MNKYLAAMDRHQQMLVSIWLCDSKPGQYDAGEITFARDQSGIVTIWAYQQPQES